MQSYENGSSTVCKEDNWGQLATFFFKKELEWPGEVVEATLKGLPDAAHQLMEFLYSVFTQRPLPQIPDTAPRKEPSVTVPIGQPRYFAPHACAQSSIKISLWRSASAFIMMLL